MHRHFPRPGLIAASVASAAIMLAGCGGGSRSDTSSATSTTVAAVDTLAPATVVDSTHTVVRAIDNDFEPKHLQIAAGTTVEFLNAGHNKHNIIPIDPDAPRFSVAEQNFPIGSSYRVTFTRTGTWAYYCSLHATPTAGSMRGVITVTP